MEHLLKKTFVRKSTKYNVHGSSNKPIVKIICILHATSSRLMFVKIKYTRSQKIKWEIL